MLINGKGHLHSASKLEKPLKNDHPEPAPMEKLNWLIHLQHIRGEIEVCKQLIETEISRSQGKNEYVYFKQGIILKEEGKVQEALEIFQKCLKLNQKNALILKELAKCLYEMKRFRLSLNAYLEAEQLAKNTDWQLHYFIAQTYLKLGNVDKAKEYANKSVKLGKLEDSYNLLMKILIGERDFRSALAVGNAAVESCPDSVKLLTKSGLLFLKTGQPQHAFERLSQALALDQTCAKALLGIGFITHKHEEYDVALSKYKIAVLYEPESVALWNNIGMCFYAKEKYIAAISCLKRGLWISPLNWKILFNLALVHLATNQPASGFNFACAAVNLRPDFGECFGILGYTLFALKDTENALRALKQACALTPSDATLMANFALLLELSGLYEEADDCVHKFKSLAEEGQSISTEVSKLVESLVSIQLSRDSNLIKANGNVAETPQELKDTDIISQNVDGDEV